MTKWLKKPTHLLIILLVVAFVLRVYRLGFPDAYVFDEVYHAFTAKEYLAGSAAAWEWWTTPPPGVAYEWTHPPVAKELMTVSMWLLHSTDAWAWRISGVIFNLISIWMVYLIGKQLFKNEWAGLLSAFVFSFDGLNFVQSRTGMNDSYVVAFLLVSLLFFLRRQLFISAIFFGLAIASKWAALYLFFVYTVLILVDSKRTRWEKIFYAIPMFIIVPILVYIASYIPFFLLGHSPEQFVHLQQQMWWYHTNLKATHDYTSRWWSWPLNLYPVWYYVQYYPKGTMSNIFASGNTVMFIFGLIAVILSAIDIVKKRVNGLTIALFCYLAFWLPWAISPRIMFLYHYSPSIPFLSLALGYQLNKLNTKNDRRYLWIILALIVAGFAFYYPFLTGLEVSKPILRLFFYTNITKNPFGNL